MREESIYPLYYFSLLLGFFVALSPNTIGQGAVVLILISTILLPFAKKGVRELSVNTNPLLGLLGIIPAIVGVFFVSIVDLTKDIVIAVAILLLVAISEEIFRAGAWYISKTMFLSNLDLSNNIKNYIALAIANLLWVLYHFSQRPFNMDYFIWLLFAGTIFSFCLIYGGLEASILAHLITNAFASWIAYSTYKVGYLNMGVLLSLLMISLVISFVGGLLFWRKH